MHKFREAKHALKKKGIVLRHFPFNHTEIRSDHLTEIAMDAARVAYEKLKEPVFVEDSGLFIRALRGFPGTYSAWIERRIGCRGILKLMENMKNRGAYFEACMALGTEQGVRTFRGRCEGRIAPRIRGKRGFGYDPIFIPRGYQQTWAESITLKNRVSHRYKSLLVLSKYLKKIRLG